MSDGINDGTTEVSCKVVGKEFLQFMNYLANLCYIMIIELSPKGALLKVQV